MTAPSVEPTTLTAELDRLWKAAGRPSMRKVATLANGAVSHTTIHGLLRGEYARPQWPTVAAVGNALGASDDGMDVLNRLWSELVDQLDERAETPRRDTRTDAINNLAAAINNLADAYREGRASV